ncbi:MAG: hypothetical protein ACXVAX_03870, partial [Pseudobdellovibrio sp.]
MKTFQFIKTFTGVLFLLTVMSGKANAAGTAADSSAYNTCMNGCTTDFKSAVGSITDANNVVY